MPQLVLGSRGRRLPALALARVLAAGALAERAPALPLLQPPRARAVHEPVLEKHRLAAGLTTRAMTMMTMMMTAVTAATMMMMTMTVIMMAVVEAAIGATATMMTRMTLRTTAEGVEEGNLLPEPPLANQRAQAQALLQLSHHPPAPQQGRRSLEAVHRLAVAAGALAQCRDQASPGAPRLRPQGLRTLFSIMMMTMTTMVLRMMTMMRSRSWMALRLLLAAAVLAVLRLLLRNGHRRPPQLWVPSDLRQELSRPSLHLALLQAQVRLRA